MQTLQEKFEVSERRACRVVGHGRSSQRYKQRRCDERDALTTRLHELAAKHPRYGYRRMTVLLRAEGWSVNRKRVGRLWRLEGFSRPCQAT